MTWMTMLSFLRPNFDTIKFHFSVLSTANSISLGMKRKINYLKKENIIGMMKSEEKKNTFILNLVSFFLQLSFSMRAEVAATFAFCHIFFSVFLWRGGGRGPTFFFIAFQIFMCLINNAVCSDWWAKYKLIKLSHFFSSVSDCLCLFLLLSLTSSMVGALISIDWFQV